MHAGNEEYKRKEKERLYIRKLEKIVGGRQLSFKYHHTGIFRENKESTNRCIHVYKALKVEKSMVGDLGPEAVKCRNLGEKKEERYLAEVRLMLKGKWARRS